MAAGLTLGFLALALVLGETVYPPLGGVLEEGASFSDPAVFVGNNLLLALGIPASVAAVVVAHQERPSWLVSVLGRPRWRLLGRCAALAVATIGLGVAIAYVLPASEELPDAVPGGGTLPVAALLAAMVLTTPLQATGEEVVCRGYLTQLVAGYGRSRRAGPVVAAALTAALFVAAHLPEGPWLIADLTVFALVCSWTVWRTGGLEPAVALHVVNNLVAITFAVLTGTLDDTLGIGEIPWQLAIVDIVTLLLYAVAVDRWARPQRTAAAAWVEPSSGIG